VKIIVDIPQTVFYHTIEHFAMTQPIAIVGMACQYPDARSPTELWENVLAGRRAFRRLPPERLRAESYISAERGVPDHTYVTCAGLIEGYSFDRSGFRVAGDTYRQTDLAHWLVDNTASLYSANRLTGYLKSLGHRAPKSAVSDYLEWFEDAYFLFTVRIFDPSLARSNTNPKKIYSIDHALVTSVSSGILVNSGHLLENLVFTALRRLYPEIYYYRTRTGREVDFIVPTRGRPRMLVQVCDSLAEPQTRKREIAALTEAMAELGPKTGTVVTRNEDERMDVEAGTIEVVPAWRFLLGLPQSAD